MKNIVDILSQIGIVYFTNEPLKKHTSVKVGGNAKYFVIPKNKSQMIKMINEFIQNEIKYYILGNGTNTLAGDDEIETVVICTKKLKRYKISNSSIYAQCGLGLFELGDILKTNGLAGIEFAYGIPGTVGGALAMNAGAYGGFVGDFVEYVEAIKDGKLQKIYSDELKFGYRQSLVQEEAFVVLGAKFNLHKSKPKIIETKQNYYFQKRLMLQPYDMPSFGSCFKKDQNHEPVSKLIDELGLKGYLVGGAQVSKKHAGFIVNIGDATCQNYVQMIKYIQKKIFERYGFIPELEVKLLR